MLLQQNSYSSNITGVTVLWHNQMNSTEDSHPQILKSFLQNYLHLDFHQVWNRNTISVHLRNCYALHPFNSFEVLADLSWTQVADTFMLWQSKPQLALQLVRIWYLSKINLSPLQTSELPNFYSFSLQLLLQQAKYQILVTEAPHPLGQYVTPALDCHLHF